MFYRVIESRLQSLFTSSLAAQGGYVMKTTGNTGPKNLPILNLASVITKGVLGPILSKLDEKKQKKEWHNIAQVGNVEELNRIASETAGLITLYYNEQIQSIDPSQKIKGSNIFNHHLHWLKQIYNVRPESSEDMAVVLVAEYVTAWIIDGLKIGSSIIPTESIPPQLWLHVAKRDPISRGNADKATDVLGVSAGQQRITIKNIFDKQTSTKVQMQYLIGCVSVIGKDDSVYQYPVPNNSADSELLNLDIFGYVYLAPFSSDDEALRKIVEGRKLQFAKRDKHSNILTRFEDIIQHAQTIISPHDQPAGKSLVTRDTANDVAKILREQNIFVDSKAVKRLLHEAEEKIELDVEVLRQELKEKTSYYELSIEAAHEQLKQESEVNRQAMQKDNEVRYDQTLKKLNQHTDEAAKRSEKLIEQRMRDIQQLFQEETKKILAIAETAKEHCLKAVAEAQAANETSRQAVENSAKAVNQAEKLSQWAEQRAKEFQISVKDGEEKIRQATLAQEQLCKQSISDIRTQAGQDIERLQDNVKKSVDDVKESARAAQESKSTVKAVQEMMKNQQEGHNTEMKKITSEAKEMRQQGDRSVTEAKEAQRKAARAAETTASTAEQINAIYANVKEKLEQMERLAKRLNGS